MPWATLSEISEYPSPVTVTTAHLNQAQDIVEIFAGTTELASGAGNISPRNLRLLNRAVIYQAIFVANHPELLTLADVESLSADGLSATYRTANAQLLAPMADRCINRLSWRLRGIVARRSRATADADDRINRDSAVADDNLPWDPM